MQPFTIVEFEKRFAFPVFELKEVPSQAPAKERPQFIPLTTKDHHELLLTQISELFSSRWLVSLGCVDTMQCYLWQWSRSTFTHLHKSLTKPWRKTLPRNRARETSVHKETLPRLAILKFHLIKAVL